MNTLGWTIVILTAGLIGLCAAIALLALAAAS
jgi:threonine dehydrogenase-like Zn-dependent dehydrogenase